MPAYPLLPPMFALVFWTFLVLLAIPAVRVYAVRRRQARPRDFRLGDAAGLPEYVQRPNRNYMNLLELPMLFYAVCLMRSLLGPPSATEVTLAWAFVGLRVAHSLIHIGYNHVMHRLAAFALSNFALLAMWILAARALLPGP